MNSEQVIEVGKALLPYLRTDLKPEELGMAAHDAAAALHRTGATALLVERDRCEQVISRLETALQASESLKGGYLDEIERLKEKLSRANAQDLAAYR